MTSIITFDPPLGAVEHVHGKSQSHQQLSQGLQPPSIDFLFTAQLSAYDYENLVVRDGARLQIWTNIPRLEDEDGNDQAWREIEFVDPEALSREMSAYRKVSLQVSSGKEPPQQTERSVHGTVTLYRAIPIPLARAREFSFTYRVVYPSGRTTWLGFYERNGAVIADVDQTFSGSFSSRTIDYAENLSLKGGWSPYPSSTIAGFTTNAENADGLQIAKVSDMATTRIWALGKDRLLRHASTLVLVPAPKFQSSQEKLTHRLSYIISASPGATLSVSSNGGVTVSGSGSVLVIIINSLQQYSPSAVVEAALEHSDLSGSWTVVAHDTRSGTVILACTGNGLPIPAVVVSFSTLWSNFTPGPTSVLVETAKLFTLLHNPGATGQEVKEFSIFSSSRSAMHVFDVEEEMKKPGHIVLEVDSTYPIFTESHTFTLAPLYRLHKHLGSVTTNLGRNWAATILTSYRIVPPSRSNSPNTATTSAIPTISGTITDPRGLLTPPPSPPPPPGFSAEAHSESSSFRLSRTSLRLCSTAEAPNDIIPVNYAVRRRPAASNASIRRATATPRTELKHLDVDTFVRAKLQNAPSRRHSPVDKPAAMSSKRAVPKPQRSSCLTWIFRIVFKCLFASVRVFLRVVFNVRIALAWGVGLVIRGPEFTWGLLWGTGARPGRLPTLPSLNSVTLINPSAEESSHHQPSLSSDRSLSRPSRIQLSSTRNDNRSNTNPTLDSRHSGDAGASSVGHSHLTYQGTAINLDTDRQLKEPLSSRGPERSSYLNGLETSSVIEYSDSEEASVIRAHETVVADPAIRNSDPLDTACSLTTPCLQPPLLHPQSELEALEDCRESGGFFAEITPLCSNGAEIVEIVLLALASVEARDSERHTQFAYDATNAHTSDCDATLLAKAVNFIPSRHSHAGALALSVASNKNAHAPVNISPMGVHRVHLSGPASSKPPGALTASHSSILDSSATTDAVLGHENPGNMDAPHKEILNTQYAAASGFLLCYQLPRETLDHEAGTVVVAVGPPEPMSGQI